MNEILKVLKNKNIIAFLLFLIITLCVFIRIPFLKQNLPLAVCSDERVGVGILYGFAQGSFNPHWFGYPTLYYYSTFFLSKPLQLISDNLIFNGRVINILFSAFLLFSMFKLGSLIFKSKITGLISAFLCALSMILILSGKYIITDIFLSFLSYLSIFFISRFFINKNIRDWLIGSIILGLAISTKYTAIILLGAYVIIEWIFYEPRLDQISKGSWLEKSFLKRRGKINLVLIIAGFLIALFLFFPFQYLVNIVISQGGVNSIFDSSDVIFLNGIKYSFLFMSALLIVLASCIYFWNSFFDRFFSPRPYLVLAISAILFAVTNPYILIEWKELSYNFGSLLKNVWFGEGGTHHHYFADYVHNESVVALPFFIFGLYRIFSTRLKGSYMLVLYIFLGFFSILSASHGGYTRWLTPFIPGVFVISAYGIYSTTLYSWSKSRRAIQYSIITTFLFLVLVEFMPKYLPVFKESTKHDCLYSAYFWILRNHVGNVYYAGYVPDVELHMKGYNLIEIPVSSLESSNKLKHLTKNDILIFDGGARMHMNSNLLKDYELVFSEKTTWREQHIYRSKQK